MVRWITGSTDTALNRDSIAEKSNGNSPAPFPMPWFSDAEFPDDIATPAVSQPVKIDLWQPTHRPKLRMPFIVAAPLVA
jgi:hypothetical protein